MSLSDMDSTAFAGSDEGSTSHSYETFQQLLPLRTGYPASITKSQPPQIKLKQNKSLFGKLIKSTQALYDHLGEDTWILDRRLETLDKTNLSDEAVVFLASTVPKTPETKQLYRMIDEYLDCPASSRNGSTQFDEVILMIELGVRHILDITMVAIPLFDILARLYEGRFEQGSDISDIDKSIDRHSQAISLAAADPAGRPGLYNNQGTSYLTRFRHLKHPADVDRAIEVLTRAASSVSTDPTLKSTILHNLSIAYITRFRQSGALPDIDAAIKHRSQALFLLPDGHKDRPSRFEGLGIAYHGRFERLGQATDINDAINNHERAINLTPNGNPRKLARLCNLAVAYQSRFQHQGSPEDIQNAIDRLSQVVALAPSSYPELPTVLGNLGSAYRIRFQALSEPSDIEKAVELQSQALSLYSNGDPSSAVCHANLGNAYQSQFQSFGRPEDLQLAIHHKGQAVLLTPDGSIDKPMRLSNLGVSYHSRYKHLGELADLERAIECHEQAVALTPDGHPGLPMRLNSLGSSYRTRFERVGDVTDLERAIEYTGRAVSLTPEGRADYPVWLANLSTVYLDRFVRLSDASDLDTAIDYLGKVMLLTPGGHADSAAWLDTLGIALTRRFKQGGAIEDANQAIEYQTQAVSLTPDGHVGKANRLNNLGNAYHHRFEARGNDYDIDYAIEYQTLAVSLAPDGDVAKTGLLNNLGTSYSSRFAFSGVLEDVDRAINYQDEAVSSTPDWDSLKPARLNGLGNSYFLRFQRLKEPDDLAKSIKYLEQAVLLAPQQHPDRPSLLRNLGSSYQLRFNAFGALQDFDKATTYYDQAIDLLPPDAIEKSNCFTGFGSAYFERYQKFKQRSDIDKAIEYFDQAVELTPASHVSLPFRLHNHCLALKERFVRRDGMLADGKVAIRYLNVAAACLPIGHALLAPVLHDLAEVYLHCYTNFDERENLDKAMKVFQEAANVTTGAPIHRFLTSWNLARQLAFEPDPTSPLKAYKQTMELLHQVVWLGAAVGRRYQDISEHAKVVTEAAAVAIGAEEYELALEWLEQGRSIVWNQMLQLRNPLDELAAVDPGLAQELKEVAGRVDQSSSLEATNTTLLSASTKTIEEAAQEHRRLAERWDKLLDKARHLPGMSNLLRPKKLSELARAAEHSTIVILNVHRKRYDALVIPENTTCVSHVALPNFYETAAESHAELVSSLQHANVRDRGLRRPVFEEIEGENKFESVLASLWDNVASPVLDHLGYLSEPRTDGRLPHITWCATGSLAFLPIHAAGYYDESPSRVFDYVVSSYTPTLSTMLVPHQTPTSFRGILTVGQANTTGCSPLPGTVAELEAIRAQSNGLRYTQFEGDDATPEAIIAAMEVHDWVHLACHGSQNTADPTKSAFHVHGGTLDLATITRKSMNTASLAFLSACQTATGDEKLPEEAVHLAAGMMVAGYRSVIATMWSIHDSDAPLIAEKVYGSLLEGGVPDARKAATALHHAVGRLREVVGEKEYSRWVPYVHFGV
ncbi:hypothetical protein FRC07_000779 [Ceratobasidium sp. 392]|nr:hypothetical protein FRC07_000779 [Ceratobasidium sp. 392]